MKGINARNEKLLIDGVILSEWLVPLDVTELKTNITIKRVCCVHNRHHMLNTYRHKGDTPDTKKLTKAQSLG